MIALSANEEGVFEAQLTWPDGSKTCIPLGRLSAQQADNIRSYLERTIGSGEILSTSSTATTTWPAGAPDGVSKHLEWLSLVEAANTRVIPTLAEWLQYYIDGRSDVRPTTRVLYRKTERHLLRFFGKDLRIDRITPADARDFHSWMKTTRGLSDATACLHCNKVKHFLKAAVTKRLIPRNPFAGLRLGRDTNPGRRYFVTREEAETVLRILPTAEWRFIFALCRYGGLRCPSEVTRLRWEDVDWNRNRFTVRSPKTKRYNSGGVRQVPIFPELLPHFQAAYRQAKKDAVYIITHPGRSDARFAMYIRYRLSRAGIKPWPKFFQNLRSTRETELAEVFPLHVACAWIGNTKRIAAKHYLQVTETQYERAAAGTAVNPSAPDPQPVIPDNIAERWPHLPKDVKEAILTLASAASHVNE